jgi:transcriptional regulator GlxA family with amidase domain
VRVVLFLPLGIHAIELAGIRDALFEANQCAPPGHQYCVEMVALRKGPLNCASRVQVLVDGSMDDAPPVTDTFIVVGTYGIPTTQGEQALAWIRQTAAQARRYGAVCTGAFLLGEAGLIDGHRVTTHWQYAGELANRYPSAKVDQDRIFVRDGALFTSTGSSAAIDLALSLIEEDFGRERALWVARRLVVFLKRPGGQSQFSVHLSAGATAQSPIERVQQFIRDNPQKAFTLTEIARHAAMSPRNFSRVFRHETGISPAAYVERSRVEHARRLLEESKLPVQQALYKSGFGSPVAGRRAFRKRLGLTPSEYRERFRSSSPSKD